MEEGWCRQESAHLGWQWLAASGDAQEEVEAAIIVFLAKG